MPAPTASDRAARAVVVTGATRGIGRAVVEGLTARLPEVWVWLGARDAQRGEAVRGQLLAARPEAEGRLAVLPLDVADEDSVAAAASLLERAGGPPLWGIVNNAGVADGNLQAVLEVNVRGIDRVCRRLGRFLGPGGRVVNVSSAAGPNYVARCPPRWRRFFTDPALARPEFEALVTDCLRGGPEALRARGLPWPGAYGFSKALANALTAILAREHPEWRVAACTPGFVDTELGRRFLGGRSPAEAGMKTPAQGAEVILYLLTAPGIASGGYYGSDGRPSPLDRYREPGPPVWKEAAG
ncbi:MAG: dehydrogenase [Porticoccaceae bacterium]|nr:MAG: dehydrogenase [Porticoccaceae bacterium]